MNIMAILEVIKIIGAAAGGTLSIITLVTLILKKPKQWLQQLIKETTKDNFDEIKEEFNKIHDFNDSEKKTSLNILRHDITVIYERYKTDKKIPSRIKEDLCILYEDYDSRGGNSYVHTIMEEMMEWDVI